MARKKRKFSLTGDSKYRQVLEKLDEAMEMFEDGAAVVEVAHFLDIDRKTVANWMRDDRYTEFHEFMEKGLRASEAWWSRQGRINLENKYFQANLWALNMVRRFGWRRDEPNHEAHVLERPDQESTDVPSLSDLREGVIEGDFEEIDDDQRGETAGKTGEGS